MADLPYLPWGMTSDVQLTVTIEGDADKVMADLRRMRERGLRKKAALTTVVFRGEQPRYPRSFELPTITGGNTALAIEHLNKLVQQRRLTPELERKLDDLIGELEIRTASNRT